MVKKFWKNWKNITAQEKKAIKALKIAKKIILENISKEEIIAIYAKGSFIRREMNKHSDLDIVPIVKHSKTIIKLKKIENKFKDKFDIKTQLSGYSIWELKRGKRSITKGMRKNRAGTSRILKQFEHYKLIYGKPLDTKNFPRKSHEHDLRSMVSVFRSLFIPLYKKGELGFAEIVKQVFWLVENERRFLEKPVPHSWKALDKSIKDKSHIIHLTYKYRLDKPRDKILRKEYLKKLKEYLQGLGKII